MREGERKEEVQASGASLLLVHCTCEGMNDDSLSSLYFLLLLKKELTFSRSLSIPSIFFPLCPLCVCTMRDSSEAPALILLLRP
jgi:hypothetical protein